MSLADNHFKKSPLSYLDYTVDWEDWLDTGETISSVVWTVQTGLTYSSDDDTNTTTSATCWISGGTVGTKYSLVCKIVTSDGRTAARTIYVTVEDR